MKKKILIVVVFLVLVGVGKYIYDVNINHNFQAITENKVYKSGVIPPDEIADYVKKYNIKSIVDLRRPGTSDLVNNPELKGELQAEKEAVAKIPGVNYFDVGSTQVPDQQSLDNYFAVMDNPANYPVLIHCHHGEGRAPLFGALYRIEYEGFSNEDARKNTRALVKWSSFDEGKPKGDFLTHYKSRKQLAEETK